MPALVDVLRVHLAGRTCGPVFRRRTWTDDPERLDEVEARLALYRRLAARFHCDPDDLAARRDEVESRLVSLDRDDADLAALDAPLAAVWTALKESAARLPTYFGALDYGLRRAGEGKAAEPVPAFAAERDVDRLLVDRFVPASVVVNEQMHIVQFRGKTGPYLEPAAGEA